MPYLGVAHELPEATTRVIVVQELYTSQKKTDIFHKTFVPHSVNTPHVEQVDHLQISWISYRYIIRIVTCPFGALCTTCIVKLRLREYVLLTRS